MRDLVIHPLRVARFSPDGPVTDVLHRRPGHEVTVTGFEPHQERPIGGADVDVTVTVLEGTGEVQVGTHVMRLDRGDVGLAPAGTVSGVRSRGQRLIVLCNTTDVRDRATRADLSTALDDTIAS